MFIVYGKDDCPFCVKAKALLEEKNIQYTYVDVNVDTDALGFIKNTIKARTVPQIVHNVAAGNFVVGGYDDLVKYLRLV